MQNTLTDNTWPDRQKLALTCRILFENGHDSDLAGQVAASVPTIVSVCDLTTAKAARRARYAEANGADAVMVLPGSYWKNDPMAAAQRLQRLEQLKEVLAGFSPRRREALMLHRFEGLSQTQIAERMGISTSMVEMPIAFALLHCKRRRQQEPGAEQPCPGRGLAVRGAGDPHRRAPRAVSHPTGRARQRHAHPQPARWQYLVCECQLPRARGRHRL